jgi:hypothetical protein
LILVIAALSTPASAVSADFVNDGACGGPLCNVDNPCTGCGGTAMDVRLVIAGAGGGPFTANVALAAGETAEVVADNAATALCNAVDARAGWVCGGGPCSFPAAVVSCTNAGEGLSIDISQINATRKVEVVGAAVVGLHTKTVAGNTIGKDLLEQVLVRVDPNSHPGNVQFTVTGATGGPNPFTVNTTGLSDTALHAAIAAGYNALNVKAELTTDSSQSIAPGNFNGSFVLVGYPPTVTGFLVSGQPGQILVMETNSDTDTGTGATVVPTLGEWGMLIVIALLVLSAIWMMRRRQKAQAA